MVELSTNTQLGLGFTGFGVAFIFLGVILFFDKGLLAIGNLLFLTGLPLIIGPKKTFLFFFQWDKLKGTFAFFLGIVVVLSGHPVIGVFIEAVGSYLLFKSVIPSVFYFLASKVPFWNFAKNTSIV